MTVVDLLVFFVAVATGAAAFRAVFRDSDGAPPLRATLAGVAGLAATVAVLASATLWLQQAGDPWNNARLTPAVALHYGFQLYYPLHEGPVLSTVVGPVAFLAYWPIGFLRGSPTTLILAACALNLVITCLLLVALVRRLATGPALRWLVALVGVMLAVFYPALRYSLFSIHADAPALLLGGIGAGIVIFARDGLSWTRCFAAALCLALAVWAKQSLAPIFLAVALVAALHHGMAAALRFLAASVVSGATVSAVFVGWFGFSNLRDNMFAVPARHPWHQMNLATGEIFNGLNPVGVVAHLKVLLAAALVIVRESWALLAVLLAALAEHALGSRPGRRWPRRAWAAWFLIACGLMPTAAVGRIKVGGEVNHESFAIFFLVAAFLCWLASVAFERGRPLPVRAAAVLLVLTVVTAPRVLEYPGWRNTWENQNESAYRYDLRHPGEIYFPWNPLTSLFAEGKLYHFDYGVFDRNLGGARVSPEHVRAFLPAPRPVIASFIAHHDYLLHEYFPDYRERPALGELTGWKIYGLVPGTQP
jgi:hypothetical protein